ncbi:MAG TPA: phosphoribosylamine--glycine ligase [Acidimicrobiales bacterium]|nr:phosphoribosylamine--glycine ligase [Acidimicrobiales bacterium]
MTRVCVVGSGGREHALAGLFAPYAEVVVTPGNPCIAGSVDTSPLDIEADLFVVGPEVPLVEGLADDLRSRGRLVFGPGRQGARLEGSKAWMKEVLVEAGVPTAGHRVFDASELGAALEHVDTMEGTIVVKTDGLAAGKGVLVTDDRAEARADVTAKLSGTSFGAAGRRVVIEEGLSGPEVSLFALVSGTECAAVPTLAQDHKRLLTADRGPNTGGMGAVCPAPGTTPELIETMMDVAVRPTVEVLARRGIEYRGVLFGGFMLTAEGPRLLEYNIRFGDPEAQVVLPRWQGDPVPTFMAVARGEAFDPPELDDRTMVTIVCAAEGYPYSPRRGDLITGLDEVRAMEGVSVFCAGVGSDSAGRPVTSGGRVLSVTAAGPDVSAARSRALAAVSRIHFAGMQYREDIGTTGPSPDAGDRRSSDTGSRGRTGEQT